MHGEGGEGIEIPAIDKQIVSHKCGTTDRDVDAISIESGLRNVQFDKIQRYI